MAKVIAACLSPPTRSTEPARPPGKGSRVPAHAASGLRAIQASQHDQDHQGDQDGRDGFGARVRVVRSPSPGSLFNELSGIETISARDIWTVGTFEDATSPTSRTLIEHLE